MTARFIVADVFEGLETLEPNSVEYLTSEGAA